jgi:aminopeptidase-like protein
MVDTDRRYRNIAPYGEPQLGRRGLYRAVGGAKIADLELAMLWVLSLSDGEHALTDIARRARLDFASVVAAADLLTSHGLLTPI